MCRCISKLGVETMSKHNILFKEVIKEEYTNLFEFYVNFLGFQYLTGDEHQIKAVLNDLDIRNEKYTLIEGLKCGSDYILYMDGGIA